MTASTATPPLPQVFLPLATALLVMEVSKLSLNTARMLPTATAHRP